MSLRRRFLAGPVALQEEPGDVALARARLSRVFGDATEAIIERVERDRGASVRPGERQRLREICQKHGAEAAAGVPAETCLKLEGASDETIIKVFREMVEADFRREYAKEFVS